MRAMLCCVFLLCVLCGATLLNMLRFIKVAFSRRSHCPAAVSWRARVAGCCCRCSARLDAVSKLPPPLAPLKDSWEGRFQTMLRTRLRDSLDVPVRPTKSVPGNGKQVTLSIADKEETSQRRLNHMPGGNSNVAHVQKTQSELLYALVLHRRAAFVKQEIGTIALP